jgi:hypothetical protein
MNTDIKNNKRQKLVLPDINFYTSRSTRFITKAVLMTFLILIVLLGICSVIAFNVRIENIINVNGILEPSDIHNAQLNSWQLITFVSENDAGKLSSGQSVKVKISFITRANEENLCSGKIALIDIDRNHDPKKSSGFSNLYRVKILLDSNVIDLNDKDNLNKPIQINAKIITTGELLFNSIIKQFKNILTLF